MKSSKENTIGSGLGIGIIVGVIIGSLMDNVGMGIALGIVLGAALGDYHYNELKKTKDKITFSKGKGSLTIKLGEMFKEDKSKQSSLKKFFKKHK